MGRDPLREVFVMFDLNGSGGIAADELQVLFCALGMQVRALYRGG